MSPTLYSSHSLYSHISMLIIASLQCFKPLQDQNTSGSSYMQTNLQDRREVHAVEGMAVAVPRHADPIVEASADIGGLNAQGRGEELQCPARDLRPRVLLPQQQHGIHCCSPVGPIPFKGLATHA